MQIFKIVLIILLLFACSFLGLTSHLLAQNTNPRTNAAPVTNTMQPTTAANTNMQTTTPAAGPAEMQAAIQAKLDEAKTYLKQADDFYNAGEYDQGAEYANKAEKTTDEITALKSDLAKYNEANSKIEEAKSLIGQAENKEADKLDSEDLANAKTALLSAQNSFEKKDFPGTITFADESITNAKLCLTKIDAQKNVQEQETITKPGEVPSTTVVTPTTPQSGKTYGTGEFKIKTSYVVRLIPSRRDCLWRIAEYKYIYDNPWKWPIIYKANKNQIKNPDLIYPGQNFDIPELDENGNPISFRKNTSSTEPSPKKNVPIEVKDKNDQQ